MNRSWSFCKGFQQNIFTTLNYIWFLITTHSPQTKNYPRIFITINMKKRSLYLPFKTYIYIYLWNKDHIQAIYKLQHNTRIRTQKLKKYYNHLLCVVIHENNKNSSMKHGYKAWIELTGHIIKREKGHK